MARQLMAKAGEIRGMAVVLGTSAFGIAMTPAGMAAIEFIMHILRIPHGH